MLISAQVDVDVKDENGETPMQICKKYCDRKEGISGGHAGARSCQLFAAW